MANWINLLRQWRKSGTRMSRSCFLRAHGVTDDPVGATHWVVTNGIRFSAMPSFEGTLTDNELWQVSQFLKNADKLPPPDPGRSPSAARAVNLRAIRQIFQHRDHIGHGEGWSDVGRNPFPSFTTEITETAERRWKRLPLKNVRKPAG